MIKNRVIVSAVILEGRSKAAVARDYDVSWRWVHTLVTRYLEGGWDAVEPRSKRPKHHPTKTSDELRGQILQLRTDLSEAGYDAGAETIQAHLERLHGDAPSTTTIWRILRNAHLVTPQPRKRPRSSYTRFEAEFPNETWQSDFIHWTISKNNHCEIITWLDDHSRYALSITVHRVTSGSNTLTTFRQAVDEYGPPASTLTDNGLVFTTRSRNGPNKLENELRLLGITQKNGRPNHPQTQGKVERFQQTLKKWLAKQPKVRSMTQLQAQIDTFRDYYNHQRPHRSLGRQTPHERYTANPKIGPQGTVGGHWRIRDDTINNNGTITLRYAGNLHHIGLGRTLTNTPVRVLIHDRSIRVIHRNTGDLIRALELDPTKDYQPQTP